MMSANCFSFWWTLSPDPLPRLRPWTPLGPPDLLENSPQMKILGIATARIQWESGGGRIDRCIFITLFTLPSLTESLFLSKIKHVHACWAIIILKPLVSFEFTLSPECKVETLEFKMWWFTSKAEFDIRGEEPGCLGVKCHCTNLHDFIH